MTREEYEKHIEALSLHLTYPELDHLHAINDHDAGQRAEIARLKNDLSHWTFVRFQQLESEAKRFREALKFYADPHTYGISGGSVDNIIKDAGERARLALKETT